MSTHPFDDLEDVEMPADGWPTYAEIVAALFAAGDL